MLGTSNVLQLRQSRVTFSDDSKKDNNTYKGIRLFTDDDISKKIKENEALSKKMKKYKGIKLEEGEFSKKRKEFKERKELAESELAELYKQLEFEKMRSIPIKAESKKIEAESKKIEAELKEVEAELKKAEAHKRERQAKAAAEANY